MLTDILPQFTSSQVALVTRLINAPVGTLHDILAQCGLSVSLSMSRTSMTAKILRSLDDEDVQKHLCEHGLADHSWFGLEPKGEAK